MKVTHKSIYFYIQIWGAFLKESDKSEISFEIIVPIIPNLALSPSPTNFLEHTRLKFGQSGVKSVLDPLWVSPSGLMWDSSGQTWMVRHG